LSDPVYKKQRSKAKDARQAPTPECCPPRSRSKKDKPVIVEWRMNEATRETLDGHFLRWAEWRKFGRYRNEQEAQAVVDNKNRSLDGWEFRIKPQEDKQ